MAHHQLLADAGLARDQHGQVRGRRPARSRSRSWRTAALVAEDLAAATAPRCAAPRAPRACGARRAARGPRSARVVRSAAPASAPRVATKRWSSPSKACGASASAVSAPTTSPPSVRAQPRQAWMWLRAWGRPPAGRRTGRQVAVGGKRTGSAERRITSSRGWSRRRSAVSGPRREAVRGHRDQVVPVQAQQARRVGRGWPAGRPSAAARSDRGPPATRSGRERSRGGPPDVPACCRSTTMLCHSTTLPCCLDHNS